MKPAFPFLVASIMTFFCSGSLRADWLWQNDMVSATATAKWYEGRFSFENKGSHSITVTDVAFSCPCTVFHFTATTAKAGETGTLTVRVQRQGNETVGQNFDLIATGSPSTTPRELTLHIDKPDPAP